MGYYQLKTPPNRDEFPKEWVVKPEHACPGCGERATPLLWWISNKSIRCKICGTKFQLNEDRSGVVKCS